MAEAAEAGVRVHPGTRLLSELEAALEQTLSNIFSNIFSTFYLQPLKNDPAYKNPDLRLFGGGGGVERGFCLERHGFLVGTN